LPTSLAQRPLLVILLDLQSELVLHLVALLAASTIGHLQKRGVRVLAARPRLAKAITIPVTYGNS
jgi:hypothetical protein